MKAPDRIYFDGNNRTCKLPIFSSTNIEYVRKDAFIERVAKWLDNNIWAYIEIMHPTVDSYTHINRERLIWDFKKVMRQ